MKKRRSSALRDDVLATAKRERQALARAQVAAGQRTQESLFLIAPEVAKAATVRHRVLSF